MAFDKRKALQNALTYTQQGKWDRAIGEYQSILKADPRDVTVYNNLGDLFARAGKTAEAIEHYLKLGELYRADGLSVKAIAVYKKIAKLDPARTEAYLACADLYWEQGLVGEAKIQMATVVEHYSKAGDAAKLIEAYKRLVYFDPNNSSVVVRLADALLRDGKREAAAAEYERAGQFAEAAGHAAEAKRLMQKARDLSPRAPEATVAEAERLIAAGKASEGLDVLRTVTRAEPGNATAWRLLGRTCEAHGRTDEGLAALARAVSLGVAESDVAQPLGRAFLQAGRVDDAVALCRRVTAAAPDLGTAASRELLEMAPQCVALHALLAGTLEGLGRVVEACAALRALAATQEATGETVEAIATYRRLIAVDPSDTEARARLEALVPSPLPSAEPLPAPAEPARAEAHEVSSGPAEDDNTEALLSSLDELELALGTEDAALLLDEASAVESTVAPDLEATASEAGLAGGGQDVGEASSESSDWLTRELQTIDLGVAAGEGQPEPPDTEWADGEGTRDAALPAATEEASAGALDVASQVRFDASRLQAARVVESPDVVADGAMEQRSLASVPIAENPDVSGDGFDEQSSLIDVPAVELPDVPAEPAVSALDLPTGAPRDAIAVATGEDAHSGHIAEQLAEADVYQKYGLEEKARERLVEVVRLAPGNLTARRRLKAIYVSRSQFEMACDESAAIVRILRSQGHEDAALAEVRDGLALVPTHKDLQQFLLAPPPRESAGRSSGSSAPPPAPPRGEATVAPVGCPLGATTPPRVDAAGPDGAPPPDVPLLFDWDQTVSAPEAAEDGRGGSGDADSEALPRELQALLEGGEALEPIVVRETESEQDQAVADDVAEAEFYLSQGMTEEARAVCRRMQLRDPKDPSVIALAAQIERASMPARTAEPEPAAVLQPGPLEGPVDADAARSACEESATQEVSAECAVAEPTATAPSGGFVDLGAELAHELDGGDRAAFPEPGGPLVNGLIKELQRGVQDRLDEKDFETHYNLGIAYKEMELYDEAIQEFRLTARDPKRALECADLVGLCYLAKGQPEQAVQDLQAGLAIAGHPPEAYHDLRHDLGAAFEAQGDLARALEQFEILQAEGAGFHDVAARVQALRGQVARPAAPASNAEKPRRKKKISFI
jgi:tetratricopeptide (TPR) repeat protein